MRVAMLAGALNKGGTERVIVNLADFLAKSGHQVVLVTQYQKENEYALNGNIKRIISDITPEETTGNRVINFCRRFRKLRSIWKTEKPDVILSFIGKNNLMALITSCCLPISTAVSVRGDPQAEYYTRLLRWAARYLFRYADGVVLQTAASRLFFPAAVRKKVKVLKNPVSPSFFRPRYEGERERTIVAVGRVDENKNHRMLMAAFAGLADDFPQYKLYIYGEGNLRSTLLDTAKEMGLAERILLPGSSDHIPELIYKASLFVLTSDTEGVPNTLLEAMLSGLTVMATDCPCGGPAELIRHGINGLLTPVRDMEKLKDNMRYVLDNPREAAAMGIEAARLQDVYDPDRIGKEWEQYLSKLCHASLK